MNRITILLCAVLLMAAATPDRWIGTWKLNPAKSHFESGPLPKSRTMTLEEVAGGMKAISDLLDDYGSVHIEFSARYDGKDVPMRGSSPGSTIALTRLDASTFDSIQKNNGNITVTTRFAVSKDGKILTVSAGGIDPQGKKFTNVSVFDRQ